MLSSKKHIHFVGIGGIGMSALAGIAHKQGHTISGSDNNLDQQSIHKLALLGCHISEQKNTSLQSIQPDLIIYSTAISHDSPIMQEAHSLNIPTLHRADLLAEFTRLKNTIAVTGAHGKTTTSAMIGHILIESAKNPTLILGGFLQSISSNYYLGNGEVLVVEADESDRSMLKLHPKTTIITNIDREHLDTYQDAADMKAAFFQFIQRLPQNGHAIIYADSALSKELAQQAKNIPQIKTTTYGRSEDVDIRIIEEKFDIQSSQVKLKDSIRNSTVTFSIPFSGPHMVENATAAYISAAAYETDQDKILQALATFPGTEQRFTKRGYYQGAQIIDDYAHHPTEIAHTITSALRLNPKRLIVVFQPQRYSRTKALWNEFIAVFSQAPIHTLIITDIYSASEKPTAVHITSANLVHEINNQSQTKKACYIPLYNGYNAIIDALNQTAQENDLILFLGAGKVNGLSQQLSKR